MDRLKHVITINEILACIDFIETFKKLFSSNLNTACITVLNFFMNRCYLRTSDNILVWYTIVTSIELADYEIKNYSS